jgi:long-chain acyl-CoA synthetase
MKERNVAQLLTKQVKLSPTAPALSWMENEQVVELDFQSYYRRIQCIAINLKQKLNINENLALFAPSGHNWHLLDVACACVGITTIPIYPNISHSELTYIIKHSDSKHILIDSQEQFDLISTIDGHQIKTFITLNDIVVENDSETKWVNLNQLINYDLGSKDIDELFLKLSQISQDSIFSIIYTSGTTGTPKGAIISQSAFTNMLYDIKKFVNNAFSDQDSTISFLPLSHVLGRSNAYFALIFGWKTFYTRSINTLFADLKIIKPTVLTAVPRVFEKMYERIWFELDEKSILHKYLFKLCLNVSSNYHNFIKRNNIPPVSVQLINKLSRNILFNKIKAITGGRIRYFVCGGAPLSNSLHEFYQNIGFTILEGYGLTETSGACSLNPTYLNLVGSVGLPLPSVEIKLASDHEILIKSPSLFNGYYKDTNNVGHYFTSDGFFMTGDVGEITPEGYLKIIDRKKDIIITSSGKNISPQKIEALVEKSKLIEHIIVIGDQKKYATALIAIEKKKFLTYFDELAISKEIDLEELSNHPAIRNIVRLELEKVNAELSNYECIKKFTILPIEITTNNYLTPSLKVKKRKLIHDYLNIVDAMYNE